MTDQTIQSTIIEIINFLDDKSDYMVIGSFALNLHKKFPYSDDFDISLKNKIQIKSWAKYFVSKDWKITGNQLDSNDIKIPILTLEKSGTTLDLIFDPGIFKKFKTVSKRVGNKNIKILELEAMFLRKLSAAFKHPERGIKRITDLKGALALVKKVKNKKAVDLFKKVYYGQN
jgi:hypothetical protein